MNKKRLVHIPCCYNSDSSCEEDEIEEIGPFTDVQHWFESDDGRWICLTFNPEHCSRWEDMSDYEKEDKMMREFQYAENVIDNNQENLVFGIVTWREIPYDDYDYDYDYDED